MTEPEKIRLVMLTTDLGMGGSERQLYLLLSHLDRERFEAHVIVFNRSENFEFNQDLEQLGIGVWPVPPTCRGIFRRMSFIYRMLRQLRPHIVHSWSFHNNPYAGIVGRAAGVPVRFGSLRNSLQFEGTRSLPPLYKSLALLSVSRLVVNAESIQNELLRRSYPAHRIIILPNCVEIERFQPDVSPHTVPAVLEVADGERVVGLIANLRRAKNHALFVHAMARVTETLDDVRGLIVGQPVPSEPDLPRQLQAMINDLNLQGKVMLVGFQRDVPALLQRMQVVCLTSHTEGTPNVVLEAMAARRPVVATRVGGVPELIADGINGLLVEPGDVEGLACAITRLLNDPDLAQRLAAAGQRMVQQQYSCDRIVRQLEQLYVDALRAKHRAGIR